MVHDVAKRQVEKELRDNMVRNPDRGWERFLAAYGDLIRNLIWNFRLTQEDREEVFQEVCHTLVKEDSKAVREWDPDRGSLATYLSVITVRTSINFVESGFHKTQKRMIAESVGEGGYSNLQGIVDTTTRTAGERLQRLQVYDTFVRVLERLEQGGAIRSVDRRLLILRLVGLSYKEIEDLIGVSVGTATRRFSRLKPVLKEALKQVGISPQDLREET